MNFLSPTDILEGKAPANAQYIDVREPIELTAARWPLFENIPLSGFDQGSKKLDKSRPVVVLCQAGMRSLKAGQYLENQGFGEVWNVDGGINAASAEGAPLE
jgi:rhodanese-related sulfurtransferase